MEELTTAKISKIKEENQTGIFVIEPLAPGFGPTIANSLRRVLLSSLGGAAVTEVKLEGVTHEFATIANVKEDVLGVILNIKSLKVKNFSDEPQTLKLNAKGPGEIKASSIDKNANIEIMNPEQPIATLDKGGVISVEMTVENGRGFASTEDRGKAKTFGAIAVDAAFSPVESVKYKIENTRVGQMTNYDKVTLEIKTNGSISPDESLNQAIEILIQQFKGLVEEDKNDKIVEPEKSEEDIPKAENYDSKTKVTDLDLSSRTINALTNAGIKTIGGLSRMSDLKLSEIKGLGSKGFEEIKKLLS